MSTEIDPSKTTIRRLEQYRDRWSSYDAQTGLIEISDKLSVEELRKFEIFAPFDDRFLEKISPDVSIGRWQKDAVLFEEGTYIDLAFQVLEGEVEVFVRGVGGDAAPGMRPIFDLSRTVVGGTFTDRSGAVSTTGATAAAEGTMIMRRATRAARWNSSPPRMRTPRTFRMADPAKIQGRRKYATVKVSRTRRWENPNRQRAFTNKPRRWISGAKRTWRRMRVSIRGCV